MPSPSRLRRSTALALALAATLPSAPAHASSMDGLVVVVLGMFVGVPALVLLLISIVVSLILGARPAPPTWHRGWAVATYALAPPIALAFPFAMAFLGGSKFLDVTFVLDAPALALGVVAVLLARRVTRRA